MSNNSGPAKVRVLSSGTPEWNPGRRRGDIPNNDTNSARGGAAISGADGGASLASSTAGDAARAKGGEASNSLLWIAGVIVLFVLGSAIGGLLVTISVLFPGVL